MLLLVYTFLGPFFVLAVPLLRGGGWVRAVYWLLAFIPTVLLWQGVKHGHVEPMIFFGATLGAASTFALALSAGFAGLRHLGYLHSLTRLTEFVILFAASASVLVLAGMLIQYGVWVPG